MKSILKSVALISVFSVLTRLLGFLLRIFLSRTIGAEALGLYQVALSVFMVLLTVVSSENALLNQWIKVEISASMFAAVFGDSVEIDTLRIIINNTAADGVAYDYQFFVSSIYVEYN